MSSEAVGWTLLGIGDALDWNKFNYNNLNRPLLSNLTRRFPKNWLALNFLKQLWAHYENKLKLTCMLTL